MASGNFMLLEFLCWSDTSRSTMSRSLHMVFIIIYALFWHMALEVSLPLQQKHSQTHLLHVITHERISVSLRRKLTCYGIS